MPLNRIQLFAILVHGVGGSHLGLLTLLSASYSHLVAMCLDECRENGGLRRAASLGPNMLIASQLHAACREYGGLMTRRQFGSVLPRTPMSEAVCDKLFLAIDVDASGKVGTQTTASAIAT